MNGPVTGPTGPATAPPTGTPTGPLTGRVLAVSSSAAHRFHKQPAGEVVLVAGLGIEGDAHSGVTVQHRSRVRRDPTQPNLRQVHLIGSELFDELRAGGFDVAAGDLGENVTTRGVDLLALGRGTVLRLGDEAVVEVTGLRNPCTQINRFRAGLMAELVDRSPDGEIVRRAGIMSVVLTGGPVRPGDPLTVEAPAVHVPLGPV